MAKENNQKKKSNVFEDTRMSLGDHLTELRTRLIKAMAGIAVAFLICLIFANHLFSFLAQPLLLALEVAGREPELYVSTLPEAFITYLKVAFFTGIFLSSPWVFYHLWGFIAVGLFPTERRFVNVFMPFSAILFILGGLFFIMIVAPISFNFFISFGGRMKAPELADSALNRILIKAFSSLNSGNVGESGKEPGSKGDGPARWIPIHLTSLRAGSGEVLTMRTGPALQFGGNSPGGARITWPAGGRDPVLFALPLPPGFTDTSDLRVHCRIAGEEGEEAVGFAVAAAFDEAGEPVESVTTTHLTTEFAEHIATLATADIPSGAVTATVELTPLVHPTEAMTLTALWLEYSPEAAEQRPLLREIFTLQKYVTLVLVLALAFSIAFQMPLVVLCLGRLGLVKIAVLRSVRKYVLLGIVALSAVMTPPDVITQVLLSVPMYILYEFGIILLRFWPKPK